MRTLLIPMLLLAPLRASAQQTPPVADRLQELERRLEKLEGAPAKTSLNAFNPAIGLALDQVGRFADDKANFEFRTAELNLEAPIDPFTKGWAIINAGASEVQVEEMAIETTRLPWNLTVRGGRLFADFGRMGRFHDDALPVTDRPASIETFLGGESQADGIETSYLLPFGPYLAATLGMYNKIGGENDREANDAARNLNKFSYLGRLATAFDLGYDHTVQFGASAVYTPRRTVIEDLAASGNAVAEVTKKNTWRTLSEVDLTYRYEPTSGGIYRGLLWGTEVLVNNERRFDDSTRLPTDRTRAFSGYSFVQAKFGRRWRGSVLFDLTEDLDNPRRNAKTLTFTATWYATEFQRLRASYARKTDTVPGSRRNDIATLQWTAFIGHHVHGFRDR